tara:strand:+ start:290 stop:1303 length:1014 start_codon:yes stop_codon:yes gene_type:complete
MQLDDILGRVAAGQNLTMEEMTDAIGMMMEGSCSDEQIGLLLMGLKAKGETVDEVAGAAAAMRRYMTPVSTERKGLLDTCGTGGDGSGTFNISTAAALVTAAAGVPVAKHGNRAITSKTGSADVLAALGVNVDAPVEQVQVCLDQLGIGFCFAPLLHKSMRHVATVRKKLGVPTIFNMLGPLSNPAGAPFQLLGVGRDELRRVLAEALVLLGTTRAIVVHGEDGLDEVTLGGTTHVTEATPDGLNEFSWTPADFGLAIAEPDEMLVADANDSASLIRAVLDGHPGPPRDIVVLNAAAGLWVAGAEANPHDCAALAAQAIDSGAAGQLLDQLAKLSQA